MLVWAWVLVVLIKADGVERDWNSYYRAEECVEVLKIITHHREDQIQARCEFKQIDTATQGEPR